MSAVVDHVIVCVPDLDDSVAAFESEHQVISVRGGRHRGHGTANRLIPLGESYIELVAVVDVEEAQESAFGSWVQRRASLRAADGVAIRSGDLDSVCARLDLEPLAMSRPTDTGEQLQWRIAGLERLVNAGLPFFIQWDIDPERHPGRIAVAHPRGDVGLGGVVLTGDVDMLRTWTVDLENVKLRQGEPGVTFELIDG
jgi:hypothetical protein